MLEEAVDRGSKEMAEKAVEKQLRRQLKAERLQEAAVN